MSDISANQALPYSEVYYTLPEVYMHGSNSCLVTGVRALLIAYEGFQGDFEPSSLDTALQREENGLGELSNATAYLAERGYEVHEISDFDHRRFAEEGHDYLRERERAYADEHAAVFDQALFDKDIPADAVAERQSTIALNQARLDHTGRYTLEQRRPTSDDIIRLLGDFGIVGLGLRNPRQAGMVDHFSLVHGYSASDDRVRLNVFVPQIDGDNSPYWNWNVQDFQADFDASAGIIAVRPSASMGAVRQPARHVTR